MAPDTIVRGSREEHNESMAGGTRVSVYCRCDLFSGKENKTLRDEDSPDCLFPRCLRTVDCYEARSYPSVTSEKPTLE